MKNEKLLKNLSKIVFILYILIIIWVVVFKCNLIDSITKTYAYYVEQTLHERFSLYLVPFQDYIKGPFLEQINNTIKDDILNVIIFIPIGLYIAFFTKSKRLIKTIIISLLLSSTFELIQLFSLIGSFATKDIITNTFGSLIGYLLCRLLYKEHNNSKIKILILNILSIIVIIIFLPIVIYAITNTINNINIYIDIINRTLEVPNM